MSSFKEINISNPGTSSKFGGNDLDTVTKLLNGVQAGIPAVRIRSQNKFGFDDGLLYIYNQALSKKTTIRGQSNNPSTDVDLRLPPITTNDVLAALGITNEFSVKQQFDAGFLFQSIAEPATPASGLFYSYIDTSDGHLKIKNSAGAVTDYFPTGGGGSGEANTASNLTGTGGAIGFFKTKVGVDLQFKKLNVASGSTWVTVTDDTSNNEVDINVLAATTSLKGVVELATDGEVAASLAVQANDTRLSNARTPTTHATTHKSAGSDVIKLDELAAPTDITTLNADIAKHGLLPKLSNDPATFLNGTGGWSTISGSGSSNSQQLDQADFIIYKIASLYYAFDFTLGTVTSNSSFLTILTGCVDALSSIGGMIIIAAGDYSLTGQFSRSISKICIRGAGSDITRITYNMGSTGAGFKWIGSVGTGIAFTANSAEGTNTITVADASPIAAGDWLYIRRNVVVDSGTSDRYDAEIHKVDSVDTGTDIITLGNNLYADYNTADTATLYKISWVDSLNIQGLTFLEQRASVSSVTEQADTFFLFCKNMRLYDVKFENMYFASCGIQNCFNSDIMMPQLVTPQEITGSGNGIKYGLYILSATTDLTVTGGFGERCRHTITTNTLTGTTGAGRRRGLVFNAVKSFNATTANFDTHQSDINPVFNACVATSAYQETPVTNDSKGFNTRSPATFNACQVVGPVAYAFVIWQDNSDAAGTDTQPGGDRTTLNACRIQNIVQAAGVGRGIRIGASSTSNRSSIIIIGCQFYNVPDEPIRIENNAKHIIIKGNMFHSCGGDLSSSAGLINCTGTVNDLTVIGNDFGAGTQPANAHPLRIATQVNGLVYAGNNARGFTNPDPVIPSGSTDYIVSANPGYNSSNQYVDISDSGLTAKRTYTYPNVAGKHVIDAANNILTGRNKLDDTLDMKAISTPSDPASGYGTVYIKTVDSNNETLAVKCKRGGSVVEVELI